MAFVCVGHLAPRASSTLGRQLVKPRIFLTALSTQPNYKSKMINCQT